MAAVVAITADSSVYACVVGVLALPARSITRSDRLCEPACSVMPLATQAEALVMVASTHVLPSSEIWILSPAFTVPL